jgi:ABC-type multidrug transport system fused ATPase/permease subunit
MEIARALTGHIATEIHKDRMGTALVYSGADDVIIDLSKGIDTWIGEDWPNGRGFSTGQLQRLAPAGALYRFPDLKVFIGIFDEPMANCDAGQLLLVNQDVGVLHRHAVRPRLHLPYFVTNADKMRWKVARPADIVLSGTLI